MKDGWVRTSGLANPNAPRGMRDTMPLIAKSPNVSLEMREKKNDGGDGGGGGNGPGVIKFVLRGSGEELGQAVSANTDSKTIEICCNDETGS